MRQSILLLSILLLFNCVTIAQPEDNKEAFKAAQNAVEEAEKLYSKEHINYANAALSLANLYYLAEEAEEEGDTLVKEALMFIYREQGNKSEAYQAALKKIPPNYAKFWDIYAELLVNAQDKGTQSIDYAQSLLKLGTLFMIEDDSDVQDSTLKAFQILDNYPKYATKNVYKYAAQNIDSVVLEVVKAIREKNALPIDDRNTVAYADALIYLAKLSIEHESNSLVALEIERAYLQIKEALTIYEERLGTKHPKYAAALNVFQPIMRTFYPVEKRMLKRIQMDQAPDDNFIVELRNFLTTVDDVIFLYYDISDKFKVVLKNIAAKHGGKRNKYYSIIKAIEDRWYLDEGEDALLNKRTEAKIAATEFGAESEAYAKVLLELGMLETEEWSVTTAMQTFFKGFDVLELIDLHYLLTNEEQPPISLFEKYINTIPEPWRTYIIRERNLATMKLQYPSNAPVYINYLLETGKIFITGDELYLDGKDYIRTALRNGNQNDMAAAVPYLDSLFHLDPDNVTFIAPNLLAKKFSLSQVETLLQYPLEVKRKESGERSVDYCEILEILADAYFFHPSIKNSTEALAMYQNILAIYKEKEGVEYNYFLLIKKILRYLKDNDPWTVKDVSFFHEEMIRLLKRKGSKPKLILHYLYEYAEWHYENDRTLAAEPIYKAYIDLHKQAKISTKRNREYTATLYNLGRVYRKTGRYAIAQKYYLECINVAEQSNNYKYVVRSYDDLGLLNQKLDKYDAALEQFASALRKLEAWEYRVPSKSRYKSKQNAIQYVKIMRHIGRLHLDQGDVEWAIDYYDQIKKFEADPKSPLSFEKDYSLHRDLALLSAALEENEKAIEFFHYAIDNLKDADEVAEANILLADFYDNIDEDSLASIYFDQALDIDLNAIKTSYNNLSEQERLLFLKPISKRLDLFFNFAIQYADSSTLVEALNAHLSIKGLALETTTNIQSVCHATENVALKRDCYKMRLLRKQLSKASSLSQAEQDDINNEITELEKKIGLSSKTLRSLFGRKNKQLDFHQLQQIMLAEEKNNEYALAVDFLVIQENDDNESIRNVYYAAVIDPHQSLPQFVRLTEEEYLEDVLKTDVAPNNINYITDELESNYLYQLVWEPLLPYIKHAKHLHLCPTGILSKVAFGTIRTSDFQRGRVMDKWSLHYYSSLRDLLNPNANETLKESANIGLIGGVKFTFSEDEIEDLAIKQGLDTTEVQYQLDKKSSNQQQKATTQVVSRGEDFNYLPGTLQEINAISDLFLDKSWVIKHLSNTNATEENIDILVDDAPEILHIATHGFFFNTPEEDDFDDLIKKKPTKEKSLEERIAKLDNPLLRSGLALAGINRVWKDGIEINGLEDGILTALEVSNMDLFNTKLVVLSACETGRGDIDNNEGIMGLRRAFKTAGAKQLIISLWKVPDAQTSELMQLFYQGYLKGQTAHEAFETAQHTMRKRYANPYYWAAFLLIE